MLCDTVKPSNDAGEANPGDTEMVVGDGAAGAAVADGAAGAAAVDGAAAGDHLKLSVIEDKIKRLSAIDQLRIGTDIDVYWPDDKRWYQGTVTGHKGKEHEVTYTDNTVETIDLRKEQFKVIHDRAHKSNLDPSTLVQVGMDVQTGALTV